jgi:outer membrane protein assembly factor BamB
MFALSVTAFAAWSSFQGHVDNNGVIAVQPPITTPTVATVSLSPTVPATTGIDAASVIGGGYAYTLYDGGADGACIAITELANPAAPTMPIVIDSAANSITQLSTPYLDMVSNTLYVLTSQSASWALWSVDVSDPSNPGARTQLAKGLGQTGTPIAADANTESSPTYLYFGSYTGSRTGSYYQYDITTRNLATFTPQFTYTRGDDFYLAGAAFVNILGRDWVVFGSDSHNLYVRAVDSFDSALVGNAVTLVDTVNNPGPVRSSIVKETISGVEYIFFSSGGSLGAILWQVRVVDLLKAATINFVNNYNMKARTTTSTPVISENGIIYVGTYNNDGTGNVWAFYPGDGVETAPTLADVIYSGDTVQSSPIVYSDTTSGSRIDYIYFTAYSANGKGYCYYNDIDGGDIDEAWAAGGTSSNPQAFQGFASDGGKLVYGDDGNRLYIIQ